MSYLRLFYKGLERPFFLLSLEYSCFAQYNLFDLCMLEHIFVFHPESLSRWKEINRQLSLKGH